MSLQALLTYRLISTGHSLSQVCVGTREWVELRYGYTHMSLRATDCGSLVQGKTGEAG